MENNTKLTLEEYINANKQRIVQNILEQPIFKILNKKK